MHEREQKILIVDDEEVIVDILKRRFERMGFSVVTALDGLEGIDVLKKENIDLVLCDLKMPRGVTGLDVMNVARQQNPEARFVAMSGHLFSDASIKDMRNCGATLFFKKPFPSLSQVTQQIADLMVR
ncbi:MAG: response regulator [bacterium]